MPRLLLVDDNQSIHKIAETLLTATDIELTCASSGTEALELVERSGPYDVALLDTTMLGMDGWALLDRLRQNPATARMPIAMMAGVLDVVDPETIAKAPIQGFLKKPVELRDLGDRVRTLLATPVASPEPPAAAPAGFATMPFMKLSEHPFPGASDILVLEAGDVLPEEEEEELEEIAPHEPAPAAQDEAELAMDSLELEELDLEGLKSLPLPATEEPGAVQVEVPPQMELEDLPDFSPEDTFAGGAPYHGVVTDELPDLGPSLEETAEIRPEPAPAEEAFLPGDWSDESESLLEPPAATAAVGAVEHADFGPDSFLEPEASPEPTPAFLPEIPELPEINEYVTPVGVPTLEVAPAMEIEALDDLDGTALEMEPPAWTPTVDLRDEFETELEPEPDTAHGVPEAPVAFVPPPPPEPPVAFVPPPPPEPPVAFVPPPPPEPPVAFVPPPPPEPPVAFVPPPPPELPAAFMPPPMPAGLTPPPVPAAAFPPPAEGADPLQALLADPVLMDRLAKAVVARLGDEAIREIAWEVMPEMADRLHRN